MLSVTNLLKVQNSIKINNSLLPSTAPTVASLDVSSGSSAGGTAVTITGTGFISGATVYFGLNEATGVVFVSATEITCDSPAGTVNTTVNVSVTNPGGGTGTLDNAFNYVALVDLVAHTISVSVGVTPAIDTTGADFIVIATNSGGTNSITDSKDNTWTSLTSGAEGVGPTFFYAANPTVGAGHTFSNGGTSAQLVVAAFSGVKTAGSPYESDVMGAMVTGSPATVQPGNINANTAGDLLLTSVGVLLPTGTSSVDSGFTITDQNTEAAGTLGICLAYKIAPNSTPINPTWTIAANNRAQANAAAFEQA